MGMYFSVIPLCDDVCICQSTRTVSRAKTRRSRLAKDVANARKSKVKLLMIGLDNAGKTTTVMHLLGQPSEDVVPTIGFSNIEMKQFNRVPVEIYDLGGGPKIRAIWKNYFALVHGIIYVVDSSAENRLPEVRENLEEVMKHDRISKKPLLVLINKQDVEGAMEEVDMSKQLNLSILANTYQCPTRIESTSARAIYDVSPNASNTRPPLRDPGIETGYTWLVCHILKNWAALNERVEMETKEQIEIERQVMNERYRRFRKNSVAPQDTTIVNHPQHECNGTASHFEGEAVVASDDNDEKGEKADSGLPSPDLTSPDEANIIHNDQPLPDETKTRNQQAEVVDTQEVRRNSNSLDVNSPDNFTDSTPVPETVIPNDKHPTSRRKSLFGNNNKIAPLPS